MQTLTRILAAPSDLSLPKTPFVQVERGFWLGQHAVYRVLRGRLAVDSFPPHMETRLAEPITYVVIGNNVSNLWVQPSTGGVARRVTNFTEGRIFQFAWAPDGKKLAVARGASVQNAVMISNFQQNGGR
jgi:hypothetical protein